MVSNHGGFVVLVKRLRFFSGESSGGVELLFLSEVRVVENVPVHFDVLVGTEVGSVYRGIELELVQGCKRQVNGGGEHFGLPRHRLVELVACVAYP